MAPRGTTYFIILRVPWMFDTNFNPIQWKTSNRRGLEYAEKEFNLALRAKLHNVVTRKGFGGELWDYPFFDFPQRRRGSGESESVLCPARFWLCGERHPHHLAAKGTMSGQHHFQTSLFFIFSIIGLCCMLNWGRIVPVCWRFLLRINHRFFVLVEWVPAGIVFMLCTVCPFPLNFHRSCNLYCTDQRFSCLCFITKKYKGSVSLTHLNCKYTANSPYGQPFSFI